MVLDTSAPERILGAGNRGCSCALARYTGEPLLFKGESFRKTDVHQVLDG